MNVYLPNCNFIRGAYLIIFSFGLFLISCNRDEQTCGKSGGKAIDCYVYGSGTPWESEDFKGQFCTEINIPPCECYDGEKKVNRKDQFKRKDECTVDGGPGGPTSGFKVDFPYRITSTYAACLPTKRLSEKPYYTIENELFMTFNRVFFG